MSVENASFRNAYITLSFGLLLLIAVRAWRLGEQSWDLMALLLAGGAVSAYGQVRHRVLGRRWLIITLLTIVGAAVGSWVFTRSSR